MHQGNPHRADKPGSRTDRLHNGRHGASETVRLAYIDLYKGLDYERGLLREWGLDDAVQLIELRTPTTRETVLERARDADALVTGLHPLDTPLLRALPRLRVVSISAIGTDNIDLVAAAELGITVTNTPGYCVPEVALHTVGLIIDLARRITFSDRGVEAGGWSETGAPTPRLLDGATIGLVFYGSIPQAMTPMLRALGMRILVYAPTKSDAQLRAAGVEPTATLDELLAESDVVSVHAPLTPETRHLIGRRELALMRPDALFVNTARGAVVDEDALADALEAHRIEAAAVDVLEHEREHRTRLRGLDNVVITPHSAYLSTRATLEGRRIALRNAVDPLVYGRAPDYVVAGPEVPSAWHARGPGAETTNAVVVDEVVGKPTAATDDSPTGKPTTGNPAAGEPAASERGSAER